MKIKTIQKKFFLKLTTINYLHTFCPLKKQNNDFERISFEKVYKIYLFDRELRNLVLELIEPIETELKTKLAYHHSHKYGAEGYLSEQNFNRSHDHTKFITIINLLKRRQKDKLYVKHHAKNYNSSFSIWVMIEMLSLTNASYFYSDLKTEDKKEIAILYGKNFKKLESWFKFLTILRNICAHTNRLYFNIVTKIPKRFGKLSYNRSL